MKSSPLTSSDPRLTALACGEITDPAEARALRQEIAADSALSEAFAALQGTQVSLVEAFATETDAVRRALTESPASAVSARKFVAPEKSSTPAPRRHRPGGGWAMAPRPSSSGGKIIRFVFGAGAVAALVLTFQSITAPEAAPSENTTPQVAASSPGETRVVLRASGRDSSPAQIYPGVEGGRGPVLLPSGEGLAALVARLPVRAANVGENPFERALHASDAPLCLAGAGRAYTEQLEASLRRGRLPDRQLLRIDGLVNALLAARPREAAPGVSLEVEVVPAPWAPGHWLLRATVNAGVIDGTLVARDALGTVSFDPGQIASWRMLGCEDGAAGAGLLGVPGVVRSGERLTTLFELVPAPGASASAGLGMVKLVFNGTAGRPGEVSRAIAFPHPDGLAGASEDMRFAAAIASFGLALRNSPHKGNATLGLASQLAADVPPERRTALTALIREAAPLVH